MFELRLFLGTVGGLLATYGPLAILIEHLKRPENMHHALPIFGSLTVIGLGLFVVAIKWKR